MFHQSERHNASGLLVWQHDIHTRDFDRGGFRYSAISSIGTAGMNNVLAMLPGRDPEVFAKFPAADQAWVSRWLDWADANAAALRNTQPLTALDRGGAAGGGKPALGVLDGTGAFTDDGGTGYLFIFNPGPLPARAALAVDGGIGAPPGGAGDTWLVHEVYPREEGAGHTTPLGVWRRGTEVNVSLRGAQAQVLRLTRLAPDVAQLPLVLGASYGAAHIQPGVQLAGSVLVVTNATGLSGSDVTGVALVPLPAGVATSVSVNGRDSPAQAQTAACAECSGFAAPCSCLPLRACFGGDPLREAMPIAAPPADFHGEWYNASFALPRQIWQQRQQRQAEFDIAWAAADMSAAWLGNRLLLYPYITQPDPSAAAPRLWLDGDELPVVPSYNSRENLQARCFMGWYVNATSFVERAAAAGGRHQLAVQLRLNETAGQRFLGVFWSGPTDSYTSATVQCGV